MDRAGAEQRGGADPEVALLAVDEQVLAELLRVAVVDADADEVVPRLDSRPGWTAARRAWLAAYHRDRRAGLDGPRGEATYAVRAGAAVVGALRLCRVGGPGTLELGIWLARSARGRGLGQRAVRSALVLAREAGAHDVVARTTHGNRPARRLLTAAGARLTADGDGVLARLPVPRA